jgi:ACT domain-containing protein
MMMLVDTDKCKTPFVELSSLLKSKGEEWGLDIRIQREDIFNAMHRI